MSCSYCGKTIRSMFLSSAEGRSCFPTRQDDNLGTTHTITNRSFEIILKKKTEDTTSHIVSSKLANKSNHGSLCDKTMFHMHSLEKVRWTNYVVAVAFQITFCAEMHANDVFLFLKIIFDISISKRSKTYKPY